MKSFLILLILSFTAVQTAYGACENYAKFGAIRAYKAEVGTVQGSEGIEYVSQALKHTPPIYNYIVTIYDNNEDGDQWAVFYVVETELTEETNKKGEKICKVVRVRRDN